MSTSSSKKAAQLPDKLPRQCPPDPTGLSRVDLASITSPPPSKPDIQPTPPSALLGRLQGFMPQIQAANARLEQEAAAAPPGTFDIEAIAAPDAPHIEFNLACGVLDLNDAAAVEQAESSMQRGGGLQLEEPSEAPSDEDDSGSDVGGGEGTKLIEEVHEDSAVGGLDAAQPPQEHTRPHSG